MAAEPSVLDLGAVRSARAADAARREGARPFVVAVSCVTLLPSDGDPVMQPEAEILDAVDLVSDPGRLGEIARAMVARASREPGTHTATGEASHGDR